ncbi:MAG: GFA family protein [Alphaproteobacteria bacterium]|nr:GFA family protein [Alphaproteobacteria bacterium]
MQLSGQCLCGKVTLSAEAQGGVFHACHCDICRTWGGGPMMAFEAGANVTLQGDDNIGVYNSSEWAERGFCKTCGTHLFYRLKENRHYYLPLGLFKGTESLTFHGQSFIDKKHPGYSFAEETDDLTSEEFYAKFAS